jgi:hypothetical protein
VPNLEAYVLYIIAGAVVLAAIAWLWLIVQAFRAGVVWGLVVLLLPPAGLVFIPTHLKLSRGPLILFLLAGIVALTGLIFGQMPESRDPYIKIVKGEKHVTLTRVLNPDYAVILAKHKDAAVLQMANADVTDETLKYVEDMPNLHELDIGNTKVTDAGLASLAKLSKLRSLRLEKTAVTARGFEEHLAKLPELTEIDLSGCQAITSLKGEEKKAWRKAKEDWRAARKDKDPKMLDQ